MGHIRLNTLTATRRWKDVIGLIAEGAEAERVAEAVNHAYSKQAEATVPALDDWEKQWKRKTVASGQGAVISDQRSVVGDRETEMEMPKPAVVQVDFQAQNAAPCGAESEAAVGAVARGG